MLELGCLLVAAGWALEGRRFSAWFNAGAAVGFAVAWVVIGRVRRRHDAAAREAGTVGP